MDNFINITLLKTSPQYPNLLLLQFIKHSTGMNTTQTSLTSTTSSISTTPSTTAHCSSHAAVSRDAHRTLTPFAPIALVESLTKTNHLLVADMKGELQSINNQLYIPIQERSKHKHLKK